MSIRVHIERLVLDGLPLDAAGGAQLQQAIALQLAEVLRAHPAQSYAGGSHARVVLPALQLASLTDASALGSAAGNALGSALWGLSAAPDPTPQGQGGV